MGTSAWEPALLAEDALAGLQHKPRFITRRRVSIKDNGSDCALSSDR